MTLRVTFLGTGGAVPTTVRNTAGLMCNRDGDRLLFDVGEGTQRQMMRFGTGFAVDAVFLTHTHGDHVLGLPGLVQTWGFNDREAPLTVYTPRGTEGQVRALLEALETEPPFPLTIEGIAPDQTAHEGDGYSVRAVSVDHRTRAVGYILEEAQRKGRFDRERAEALGVPVGPKFSRLHDGESVELEDGTVVDPDEVVGPPRPGRTVVYTGDTRPTDSVVEAAADADLLVHDATFAETEAKRARETGHSTAREAAEVAARADATRLALVHVSSRYTGDTTPLLREAEAAFDGDVRVPDDGTELELPLPEEPSD
ncbi:MAG: ribonuclease Z [Halobacteriaceae archaeon]